MAKVNIKRTYVASAELLTTSQNLVPNIQTGERVEVITGQELNFIVRFPNGVAVAVELPYEEQKTLFNRLIELAERKLLTAAQ